MTLPDLARAGMSGSPHGCRKFASRGSRPRAAALTHSRASAYAVQSPVMVIAALVISILAALFSGWQAVGQHRTANYERDRRHDERTPIFIADSYLGNASIPNIRLRLKSPRVLSSLTVSVLTPGVVMHRGSFTIHSREIDSIGSVAPGKSMVWVITSLLPHTETVELEIDCTEGDEQWKVLESVDLAR